jgi:hypothetical protein
MHSWRGCGLLKGIAVRQQMADEPFAEQAVEVAQHQ